MVEDDEPEVGKGAGDVHPRPQRRGKRAASAPSPGTLGNAMRRMFGIEAQAQAMMRAGSLAKLGVSIPPGLTVGKLASDYFGQDVARGALQMGNLAAAINDVQKLKIGDLVAALPPVDRRLGDIVRTVGEGVSSQLIEQWREILAFGKTAAQLEVAASMSRIIADANLGTLALAGIPRTLLEPALGQRIGEATAAYLSEAGTELRTGLIDALRPAALAASNALMQRIRASNEQERRYELALWDLGWWMPPSASMQFFWKVGALAYEGRRVELRQVMTAAARSRAFRTSVDSWMDLEPFHNRRRFILDGLKDHQRGRYRVSIPALLPQIEGIAIDAFAPGSTAMNPKRAITTAVETFDTVMGSAMVETVTILWAHRDFSTVSPSTRTLNRQLILHGRSTGYATEANSAKVLFALDLLAALVEDSQRQGE